MGFQVFIKQKNPNRLKLIKTQILVEQRIYNLPTERTQVI